MGPGGLRKYRHFQELCERMWKTMFDGRWHDNAGTQRMPLQMWVAFQGAALALSVSLAFAPLGETIFNRLASHEPPCLLHISRNHLLDVLAAARAAPQAQGGDGRHLPLHRAPTQ